MNLDSAVNFAHDLIVAQTGKSLNYSEMNVLREMLDNKTYPEIAELYKYSERTIRCIGSDLCKKLSAELKIKITKNNLITIIEQHLLAEKQKIFDSEISPKCNNEVRDFVGRHAAITDIKNLVNQRNKIIVIQAAGGVGKSTLAKQYLNNQGFDLVLPLEMAKDKENITAVESVVEEWLKQYFQEEPGREFGITLTRLQRQLQSRKVGILIDNLEPALDNQGRLIEKHSCYVELFRVLADSNVQSITLITSRERLSDERVNGIYHYHLSVLDVTAWKEFFTSHNIKIDTDSLEAMHKVYGGNAKAMDILLGVMREDYDGDMSVYWQENCTLLETELINLVESQFNRLQILDIEAYKLLCRLACFRYQDVPRVSTDALLALLWDIPEDKRRGVIKSLRNLRLVEFEMGEYWLHPIIREQGIERLKISEEWEEVNRKAADFWTESVKSLETIDDAITAFEAYYHYFNINDLEQAAHTIIEKKLKKEETTSAFLGALFCRFGFPEKIIYSINRIIKLIPHGYPQGRLYNLLGDQYLFLGNINDAIKCHIACKRIAIKCIKLKGKNDREYSFFLDLQETAFWNLSLCLITKWDIKTAIKILQASMNLIRNNTNAIIEHDFLLLFLKSVNELSSIDIKTDDIEKVGKFNLCSRLSCYLNIASIYKNSENFDISLDFYTKIILLSTVNNYTEFKAKALTGLGELYREQDDFEKALSHHLESIELLDKIGSKCNLAEAYYQIGLTYQKMGETEKGNSNFNQAIRLFNEMEAPKQVEKVEKAKRGNID